MTKCPFDPRLAEQVGMMECPGCGQIVLAGIEHPDYETELGPDIGVIQLWEEDPE